MGLKTLFMPEVATIHWNSGVLLADAVSGRENIFKFEGAILRMQLYFEEHWARVAAELGYDVVFYDRGISDINSYMDDIEYARLLASEGKTLQDIHSRYDAVIYLVSAADGVPEFYTHENNPMRYEKTIALALETELKTRRAWLGYPRLKVIRNVYGGNRITFQEKMERAVRVVKNALNKPRPRDFERKFLVPEKIDPRNFPLEIPIKMSRIIQTYLKPSDDLVRRLHASWFGGASNPLRIYCEKKRLPDGFSEIDERAISQKEYNLLLTEADEKASPVVKLRWSFFWEGQYFQFDLITRPIFLNILEIRPNDAADQVDLPPFLGNCLEVTTEPKYTNEAIAAILK
jgi:hypothetical protein